MESLLKSSFQAFHWTHSDAQIALLLRQLKFFGNFTEFHCTIIVLLALE